jgi:prophage DNA circulation protein
MAEPLWKLQLVPASFRGATFHVDVGNRNSGRRTVIHEFPKRDVPYAEDMGVSARKFSVTGYVIGPEYFILRDLLIFALESEGSGLLTLPTMLNIIGGVFLVQPLQYSVREQRQQAGMATFDMNFVESGISAFDALVDTVANVVSAANNLQGATTGSSQTELGAGSPTGNVTIGDITIGAGTP